LVRRNRDGHLETATGSVAVSHVDAVERKPLFHFRPGSRVLTVAAPGCTFRCTYCVNHRLSQYGREATSPWTGRPTDPADLVARTLAEKAAIGMSYSEPALAPELTLELARLTEPHGIPIVWKSNGFLTPQAVDLVAPVLSAVNIDVKAATDSDHRQLTGAPLGPVLDAVERFRMAGVWVEVSTPLIPGTADTSDKLSAIAGRIAAVSPDIPWHLMRFTPDHHMVSATPSSPAALAEAVAIGKSAGLHFVYVERALGPAGRRTDCPHCATHLVQRDIWALHDNLLIDGTCPACGLAVPGVWR
jgi:pyruvate formate lyase activating enzyme